MHGRERKVWMKKKLIIATAIVLTIVLIIVSIPIFLFGIGFSLVAFQHLTVPNPPKPEITYGEFPFTLVYELNGEERVIEDTLIVEFDGFIMYGGPSPRKRRAWRSYLKSGGEGLRLLDIDETWALYYRISGDVLMENTNPAVEGRDSFSTNAIRRNKNSTAPIGVGRLVFEEELLRRYGIRIISFEIAPPIVNSFG